MALANTSLLLNQRLKKTVLHVSSTNTRLSELYNSKPGWIGDGCAAFLTLLRQQRQQIDLAQEHLADKIARSDHKAPSPLAVDRGQLQDLGAELERMSELVDRLLAAAEKVGK